MRAFAIAWLVTFGALVVPAVWADVQLHTRSIEGEDPDHRGPRVGDVPHSEPHIGQTNEGTGDIDAAHGGNALVSTEPIPARSEVNVLTPWPKSVELTLDVSVFVMAATLAVLLATGAHPSFRPALALMFFVVAPGWAVVRAFRAPASPVTLLGAVGLSVSIFLITGQILASTVWIWRPTVLGIALFTGVLLVGVNVRRT